ncbi:hypothetical protein [[Eubacterium] cellulosolvens]
MNHKKKFARSLSILIILFFLIVGISLIYINNQNQSRSKETDFIMKYIFDSPMPFKINKYKFVAVDDDFQILPINRNFTVQIIIVPQNEIDPVVTNYNNTLTMVQGKCSIDIESKYPEILIIKIFDDDRRVYATYFYIGCIPE